MPVGYVGPSGNWVTAPDRIANTGGASRVMETDVGQVAAGTDNGGWVSGSPANLALSATVTTIFDLGLDWSRVTFVTISILSTGPSSGFSGIVLTGSDTAAANPARRLRSEPNANDFASVATGAVTTAAGAQAAIVRPQGRYVTVSLTNADGVNAQGAGSKVTLTTAFA